MCRHLILSAASILSILQVTALDRVVSPTGTFNTISSAIAASSNGDRILVDAGTYTENLQLNKELSILPLVEGIRYTVKGFAYVGMASGGRVVISGIRLTLGLILEATHTVRTDVILIDSYLELAAAVDPYVHLELYRDTLFSGLSASSLTMVGCFVNGDYNTGAGIAVSGNTMLPDDIKIIGNSIGSPTGGSGINIQSSRVFHIENNFVRTNPSGTPAVNFARTGNYSAPPSRVLNNTFYKHIAQAAFAVNDNGALSPLTLKNNAIVGYSSGAVNPLPANSPELLSDHNLSVPATSINTTTGQPQAGSSLMNAGDPDPRYLDLDLTTNDVGCYGGSNSRANFTTGMGSAVVGFMNAPRVVAQGEAVNISATGFDR